jgi:hypothetical protein
MTKHCESCTNANTPICENCTFVENSKGIETPSEYIGYDPSTADEVCIGDLAALIEHRIINHLPIQVRYVIKYNKLLETRYGKT